MQLFSLPAVVIALYVNLVFLTIPRYECNAFLSPAAGHKNHKSTSKNASKNDDTNNGGTSSKTTNSTAQGKTLGLPPTHKITGIIFDMDGTLIKQSIDFPAMRKGIYDIADQDPFIQTKPLDQRRGDVLELYKTFSPSGQIKAKKVFSDIEKKAIKNMEFMDGLKSLCEFLDEEGIHRAVLTRNVDAGLEAMQDKLWREFSLKKPFHPAVSRTTRAKRRDNNEGDDEDGPVIPTKPAPDAILYICDEWGCSPQDVIMVGDSVADDIVAAYRANCAGRCLLQLNGEVIDNDSGGDNNEDDFSEEEKMERQPSITVTSLVELLNILKS